jgi:hypothetical protein
LNIITKFVTDGFAYHKSKFVILIRCESSELSMVRMICTENGLAPLTEILSMLLSICITSFSSISAFYVRTLMLIN